MNIHSVIALLLSITIASVGFVYGVETVGDNFARSGAAIVVIGIILGLFDIPSRLNSIDIWVITEAQKIKEKIVDEHIQKGISREEADKAFDKVVDESVEKIKKLAKKKKFQLMAVEALILGFGTLIWGFGDLINSQ